MLLPTISSVVSARLFHGTVKEPQADELSRGVITSAFGAMRYMEMAVDLALSVRALSSLPVSIITGAEGKNLFETFYPGVFEHVVVTEKLRTVDRAGALVAAKLECLRNSPYDLTIFLDSDMVCRRDPEFLLNGLGLDDIRVFGRRHDRDSGAAVVHHGIIVGRLFEAFGIESYVHSSLGAFAFGSRAAERMADRMELEEPHWREKTQQFRKDLPCELLFGLIEPQDYLSFYSLPKSGRHQVQNMTFRWNDDAAFIHSAPMRNREGARLISGIVTRRRKAGVRTGPSLYWVSEILNRRAEQAGLSRRQAGLVRSVCRRLYDTKDVR